MPSAAMPSNTFISSNTPLGGWQMFKHKDGSQVDYGRDDSRTNKRKRLDDTGAEIPKDIPRDRHPSETIKL